MRKLVYDEMGNPVPCLVRGCSRFRERKNGFCDPHYWRNRKYGSPEGQPGTRAVPSNSERFWQKVNKTESCWEWQGSKVSGYGVFRANLDTDAEVYYNRHNASAGLRKTVKAHRFSYYLEHGRWPDATLHLDHLCRNPKCVRPDHLEEVTQAENNRRNPNWAGNLRGEKSPTTGLKRPISWYHNKHHVRGHSPETMKDCPDCRVV